MPHPSKTATAVVAAEAQWLYAHATTSVWVDTEERFVVHSGQTKDTFSMEWSKQKHEGRKILGNFRGCLFMSSIEWVREKSGIKFPKLGR